MSSPLTSKFSVVVFLAIGATTSAAVGAPPQLCEVSAFDSGEIRTHDRHLNLVAASQRLALSSSAEVNGEKILRWFLIDSSGSAALEAAQLPTIGMPDSNTEAEMAHNDQGWFHVWNIDDYKKPPHSMGYVFLAHFDEDGTQQGDVRTISGHLWDITHPRIASTGQSLAAVWSSSSDKRSYAVNFLPLSSTGEPTGSVVQVGEGERLTHPDIAWNGSSFGVVWRAKAGDNWALQFAKMSPQGEFEISPMQIAVGEGVADGKLIATPTGWGVLYGVGVDGDYSRGSHERTLMFVALTKDGEPVGEPVQVNVGSRAFKLAEIAFNGTEIGVLWEDGWVHMHKSSEFMRRDLYFARLDTYGQRLAPPQQVTTPGISGGSAVVAWSEGAWIVGREPLGPYPLELIRLTDCSPASEAGD